MCHIEFLIFSPMTLHLCLSPHSFMEAFLLNPFVAVDVTITARTWTLSECSSLLSFFPLIVNTATWWLG